MISNPKRGIGLGLIAAALAAGGVLGWNWYQHLPKPVMTHYRIKPPALTEYDKQGRAKPRSLRIVIDESAAPVSMIEKPVREGIRLSPSLDGLWTWEDEKTLSFCPKTDWPIDTEFTVNLARHKLLAEQINLDDYRLTVRSAPFAVHIKEAAFYQDPVDPNLKKLVAIVNFSHPVDSGHFADKVELVLGDGLSFQNLGDKPKVTVSYDEFKLNAYIHSAPLAIPKEDSKLKLTLAEGIESIRGGNETAEKLSRVITVPGLYRLKFDNFRMTLVDNERFEPDQVLLIDSSAAVNIATLKDKVEAWLLPEFHPDTPIEQRRNPHQCYVNQVTRDILAASEPVALTRQPSETEFEDVHGYKFHAPVGRTLYVKVRQGVQAFGGYQARTPSMATVAVMLSAGGFETIDYSSLETSHTGDYHVGLYLIRNDRRDQQIGSTDFTLRDFEPDRIKANVKLAEHRADGWLMPEQIKAKVNAMQLFGSPAANRRIDAEMTLSPAIPIFEKFKDFSFISASRINSKRSNRFTRTWRRPRPIAMG
ncbi:MAG: hypothetical protein ACU84H_17455 [Gammaproteobacteria bacterium]